MNERILIVDDEKGIVKTLTKILTEKGFIVDSSQNSPEAMKKIETNLYDLYIVDIKMAGFSGIDLLKRIKEIDQSAPVILMTAYSDYDTLQEAIRLGAYEYIAKPFNNERLLSIVAEALEKRFLTMEGKERSALLKRAMESVLNKDYELKAQYDRLKRVSEEYRILFEFAPFPILILREDGQVIRVNRMFVEKSGYEKREVEGRLTMLDLVDEKDRDTVLSNHLKRLKKEDAPYTYHITGIRKDGERVGLTVNATLIPNTRYTFVVLKMDKVLEETGGGEQKAPAEKKKMGRAEEKEHAEYTAEAGEITAPDVKKKGILALKDLSLPAIIIDISQDRVWDVNSQALKLFNISDWRGKKFSELFPAEFVGEVRKASMSLVQNGRHSTFTLLAPDKKPHYLDLNMSLISMQGSRKLMLILIYESTVHVQLVKKLESRVSFLERIVDSLEHAILVVDENWRLVYGNHRFFHFTHLNREEAIDKSILELMPPDVMERTGLLEYIPSVIVDGVPVLRKRVDFDTEYMGYPLVMEVSYLPLTLQDGRRNAIIALNNVGKTAYYERLTEQTKAQLEEANQRLSRMIHETEKELELAKEKLVREEKLATLGQMAGGIAHELKQPLTVIKNAIYLLNTICGDNEKGKKYLDMIKEEIDRAAKIVSDIRDFGREKAPEFQSADVREIVNGAILRVERPEEIGVVVDIVNDLPCIRVDPDQISTVLENLIRNAVQAIEESGENPAGRITISAEKEKDRVRISVSDTGPGISEENLKKIFQPLFTTKKKGMGLGLALVKDLVEKNRGVIDVTSEHGKGTTFTLTFPVDDTPPSRK